MYDLKLLPKLFCKFCISRHLETSLAGVHLKFFGKEKRKMQGLLQRVGRGKLVHFFMHFVQ